MNLVQAGNKFFESWLTQAEPNAAGRLAIFRMVYGLFCLLCLPALTYYHDTYALLPAQEWHPILLIARLNPPPPHPLLLQVVPMVMAFSLVLLIVGFLTRPVTLLVMLCGMFLLAVHFGYLNKLYHGQTFSMIYIPFVMLFSRWGDCYSVDAILRQRRGQAAASPTDNAWAYFWPARTLLLLLAFLYFGAGLRKLTAGHWTGEPDLLSRILLSQNLVVMMDPTMEGRTPSGINIALVDGLAPLLTPLQWGGMLLELAFPLAVINRRFRTFFLGGGALLHAFNRLFLHINMHLFLLPYLMFVDWEALFGRYITRCYNFLSRFSSLALVGISLCIAALWTMLALRIDFAQITRLPEIALVLAVPFALYALVRAAINILRYDIIGTLFRRRERQTSVTQST